MLVILGLDLFHLQVRKNKSCLLITNILSCLSSRVVPRLGWGQSKGAVYLCICHNFLIRVNFFKTASKAKSLFKQVIAQL